MYLLSIETETYLWGMFPLHKKTYYDYTEPKISLSLYNANYMKYVIYRPKWCMIEQMQKDIFL